MRLRRPRKVLTAAGLFLLVALACAGAVLASTSSSATTALPRAKSLTAADATRASVFSKDGTLAAESVQLKGYHAHLRSRRIRKPAHRVLAKTKAGRVAAVKQIAQAASRSSASLGGKPDLTKFTTSAVEGIKFGGLEDNLIGSDPLNVGSDYSADAEGVVGPKDYLETVGFALGVFDKSSGALLAAETSQEFFHGSGLGAPCEKAPGTFGNIGYTEPHVVYDPQSDRYIVMVQVGQNHHENEEELGGYDECIAVSKTGDPIAGGWYYYAVPLFTGGLEEVGHSDVGMWTNGVYMSEILECREPTKTAKCPGFDSEEELAGTQVWAFNRSDLESGAPLEVVTTQGVGLGEKDSFRGKAKAEGWSAAEGEACAKEVTFCDIDAEGIKPANTDPGITSPPDGSEASKRNEYFLSSSDIGGLSSSDGKLDVWQWHVNWENPSEDWIGTSKTSQFDTQVTTPTYSVPNTAAPSKTEEKEGAEQYTISPTAGGHYANNLSSQFDYVMPKPEYTDFGGKESLWLAKATAEAKKVVDRVRWEQISLESATGAPVTKAPKQTQDYAPAPTTLNRWLPAIGVDKEGDMAVGYSGVSKETFASLFIAGQEKVEEKAEGKATIESLPETGVEEGHGYQTGAIEGELKITEFGPQNSMSLDPNGCEMWFAGQTDVGSPTNEEGEDNAWATQVTAFHFKNCTASTLATEIATSGQGNQATGTATLTATLKATGTKSGLYGETVTFTLGGKAVGSAVTNDEGVATLSGIDSSTYAAGLSSGAVGASYAGASAYSYGASSASGNLLVGATQTITFNPLAAKTYGEAPFGVSASASSHEPVTLTAAGTCSIAGETVTITGAGHCTITATQPGNGSSLLAATPVAQEFDIAKEPQTLKATGTWTTGEAAGSEFKASAESSVPLTCSETENAGCIYFNVAETNSSCKDVENGETPSKTFLATQTKEYDETHHVEGCVVNAESLGNQNVAAATQPIPVEVTSKGTQEGFFSESTTSLNLLGEKAALGKENSKTEKVELKTSFALTELAPGVEDPVAWDVAGHGQKSNVEGISDGLSTTKATVTGTTSQGAIAAASTATITPEPETGTVEKITDSTKSEGGCTTALATVTMKEESKAVDGLEPGEIVTIEKATKATYNAVSTEVKTTPSTKSFTYCVAKASETEEKTGPVEKTVTSIAVSGTTATAYLTAAPKTALAAKQKVNIAGVKSTSAAEYNNKTFEILSAPTTTSFTFAVKAGTASGVGGTVGLPGTGAVENEGVATIALTTEPAAPLTAGQEVEVANVGVTSYNGSFKVKEVLSAKSFTYEDAAAKEALASGAGELASAVAPCSYEASSRILKANNAGKCRITVEQAGDESYVAGSKTLELTITGGTQVVTWSPEGGNISSKNPTEITAKTNSGLAVGTITSTTATICTVGSTTEATKGTATVTVTPVAEGTCKLSAAGNEGTPNWAALAATSKSFTVTKEGAAQTLTFAEPKPTTLIHSPVTLSASASSKLPVTYKSTAESVCTTGGAHGETVTLVAEGFCKITAEQPGEEGVWAAAKAVSVEFRVTKADQILAFPDVPAACTGACKEEHSLENAQYSPGLTFVLKGTKKAAVSENDYSATEVEDGVLTGLEPSYEASGACTINAEGTKLEVTGAGTCDVIASQPGNSLYREAPQVGEQFEVTKAASTITFANPGPQATGTTFAPGATNSSGAPVSYTAAGNCTITGSGEVQTGAPGSCTVTAHSVGSANYNAPARVSQTFEVTANPSFTIEKLQTLEGAYTKSKLSGEVGAIVDYEILVKNTGNVALKFGALTDAKCSGIAPAGEVELAAGAIETYTCEHLLTHTGTYTNTASIEGSYGTGIESSNTVEAEVPTKPGFSIEKLQQIAGESGFTKAALTGHIGQTVNYEVIVKDTGNTPLLFKALSDAKCSAISPSGEVELARGGEQVYTCSHELTEAGSYSNSASITGNEGTGTKTSNAVVVEAAKTSQTIAFANPGTQTYGEPDFAPGATASSGLEVTYTTSGACAVAGGYVHLTGAGSCTVTAHQEGSASFLAATPVSQTFTVEKESQTISFISPGTQTYGESSFTPSAMASSGLAVSFKASGPCNISGGEIVLTGAGSCTITAEQAGNANFSAATPVSQTFEVEKAEQTIAFKVANHAYGEADFTISATATSGEPVTFSKDSGACTVTGNTVHLTGSGTCTIDANQAGNANYNPAPQVADTFSISTGGQTITFPAIATKEYGAPSFAPGASSSSGLTVSYSAAGQCEITEAGLVKVTGAGSCTVTAEQPGNEEFAPASSVEQSFTIEPAGQAISFTNPGTQTYGEAPFTPAATASSGLPVTFNATGSCNITAGKVTIIGAGECTLTALQSGDADYSAAAPVSYTVQVEKAEQSIDFSVAEHTYGDSDFTISATATSGDPVVFSVGAGACTVEGDTVHITGAGTCTIDANQPGDANYLAAEQVAETFRINAASQTISFPAIATKAYGEGAFSPGATASSGLTVSYSAVGNCEIEAGKVLLTGPGSCTVTAAQEGDSNYEPASAVERTFTINREAQSITFKNPGTQTFGEPDFDPEASASSGLNVTYTATGACSITEAGLVQLTEAGSCDVTAHQAGSGTYAEAAPVSQTFTVSPTGQTITFPSPGTQTYGEAPFTPVATASSGLPVSFEASGACKMTGGEVEITAAGPCTITATQAGDADYGAATPVSDTVEVEKAEQSIDFSVAEHTYGDADFTISATASSGEPVVFSVGSGECTVSGQTVHLTGAGTCTIDANQGGNADYDAAPQVADTFRIDAGSQTITFPAIPTKAYGEAAFAPGASASSKLAVSYTATGNCTIEAGLVHLTGAGSCTVTASQAGNSNYEPASAVERTFTINKGSQSITFAQPAPVVFGAHAFQLNATASSGLPVSYSGTGPCHVTATGEVTPTAPGTCEITASQAGDGDYEAAPAVTRSLVIEQVPTTIKLTPLKKKVAAGASIKFTAKVKAAKEIQTLSGTVNFYVNGKLVDSQPLTSKGVEKYTYVVTLAPSATPYTAEATFVSSASDFASSTSPQTSITVKP